MRFFVFFLVFFLAIYCLPCIAQNNTTKTEMWRCYLNQTAIQMWVAEEVTKQLQDRNFACDCGNGTAGKIMEMFTPEGCCTGAGCNCSISTTTIARTTNFSNFTKDEAYDPSTNSTEAATKQLNTQTTVTTVVRETNWRKAPADCPETCSDVTTTTPYTTSPTAVTSPSCKELYNSGSTSSGIYNITLGGVDYQVYCDQVLDGGGWTIIQRRLSGNVDFYLDWNSYKTGFGNISGEFWLGLDTIHVIVNSAPHELRIDLKNSNSQSRFARYSSFLVGNETTNYQLQNISGYSGNAGDSLTHHLSASFTTFDRDNDQGNGYNCAHLYRGAWWYKSCYRSHLNGVYGGTSGLGIVWITWSGSGTITETSMAIREI